ncbi:MAG: GNAT family N-acetyltransferase [Defluviitaleaceae bacterium]|nr:GNAT family N-acetyltransferase [Defluviitaleaceae bacterium]
MRDLAITKLADYTGDAQRDTAEVFVEGYYNWLSAICDDKKKLISALSGGFNEDVFYIAIADDKPVGITACSDNKARALRLDIGRFCEHFGHEVGVYAYDMMKESFHAPLKYPDGVAYIECVATAPYAQGKGIATHIMEHIMQTALYSEYRLEVTDNNTSARKLYEKLGFEVYETKREEYPEKLGFHERIYMKRGHE